METPVRNYWVTVVPEIKSHTKVVGLLGSGSHIRMYTNAPVVVFVAERIVVATEGRSVNILVICCYNLKCFVPEATVRHG